MHGRWPDSDRDWDGADLGVLRAAPDGRPPAGRRLPFRSGTSAASYSHHGMRVSAHIHHSSVRCWRIPARQKAPSSASICPGAHASLPTRRQVPAGPAAAPATRSARTASDTRLTVAAAPPPARPVATAPASRSRPGQPRRARAWSPRARRMQSAAAAVNAIATRRVGRGRSAPGPARATPAWPRRGPPLGRRWLPGGCRASVSRCKGRPPGPPRSSRQRCHTQVSVRPWPGPGYLRGMTADSAPWCDDPPPPAGAALSRAAF